MPQNLVVSPQTEWTYVSDQVMGGVSEGGAERAGGAVRLSGRVSTANNGGFIQARTRLDTPLPAATTGIEIEVRGNGEAYFLHLRTLGTRLPWQYYQSRFVAEPEWRRIRLDFSSFVRSGPLLRKAVRPDSIVSVGLVAFGRDHEALVELRSLSFYPAAS